MNRRRLATPLTFVLIWALVVQPVLPLQAQPTNPTPSAIQWPDLNGTWFIVEGEECTPPGDRIEMAGRIHISLSNVYLLNFCGSFVYMGEYKDGYLEIRYLVAKPTATDPSVAPIPGSGLGYRDIQFRGRVSQDGNTIEGEDIESRTRFVWQREIKAKPDEDTTRSDFGVASGAGEKEAP